MQLLVIHNHMIILLLLCIWSIPTGAATSSDLSAPPIAKPNCTTHCGNVSIPYPFGIGPGNNCYFDEWFQIDCNKTTSKPFLRRSKMEVLNISVEGTLSVNNPVTFFSCKGKETPQAPNLTGSPFVYSQDYNIFVAVSCGFLATVRSDHESVIVGCNSICENNSDRDNDGCDIGINCCQTTIPPYLTAITTAIVNEGISSRVADCNDYAFLVDQDWFEHNVSNFRAIKRMDSVPVVLDWTLSLDNNRSLIKLFEGFQVEPGRPNNDPTLYCYLYNATSTYNRSTVECYCYMGFEGNPYLLQPCQGGSKCYFRKSNSIKTILLGLGTGVGLLLLLIGAWWIYKVIKKKKDIQRKQMFFKRNGGLLLEKQLSSGEVNVEKINLFKSKELVKSTDNFCNDRILGQGGQGTVYKGMLADGRIVAVKKSKIVDEGKVSEFINEVVILSQINHRNVVHLLGCCLETEVPLLVYEFIPNGTLSQYIQGQIEEFPLTWEMRLRIATEIAGALSYLHSAASFPIYHRDIKSTNILLDEKYRAKVADFGTSRSVTIDQTHLTTLVHGTFGYLDPEYFQSSQFTEKSDVYSFGVVLVELLTGQKPISAVTRSTQEDEEEYRSLATYFITSMQEDRLFEIVDARVLKAGSKSDIIVVANLARRCLDLNGRNRPTMREVTAELEAIQMSTKTTSNAQHNDSGVEFSGHDTIENWDIVSSSTVSALDGGHDTVAAPSCSELSCNLQVTPD